MKSPKPSRFKIINWLKTHPRLSLGTVAILFLFYWFSLPQPLFQDPISPILTDRNDNLLGARIATDGQWRFPTQDSIPTKFITAITEFEDRRFFYHPGIDPVGIGRAIIQNIRNGKVVSGGSTLTMQVIRLAQKTKSRSLIQKLKETILATRLELSYSKQEIINLYAANAPFGGNVVGLDAAAWRYYAKRADLLSWGEATTLAVLPNAPALIHPGRNRAALLAKRNRLLDRLQTNGQLDSLTCALAKEEPLPAKPLPLPRLAPHLLDRWSADIVDRKDIQTKMSALQKRSTINRNVQRQVTQVLQRQLRNLKDNDIHNTAALVLDVERNEVVAYVGNVLGTGAAHGEQVDVIKAARSTGSILKPLLYALTLQEGLITPQTLLPDIPTTLSGYRPENYYEKFDGVVTAKRTLTRSLNVPMVYLLQRYGLEKFHWELQQLKFSTINKPPAHYGLPLVLGGAEATLWDITNVYAGMTRTLNHFQPNSGQYDPRDWQQASYFIDNQSIEQAEDLQNTPVRLSAAAIYQTFQAMQELERPNSEGEWRRFQNRDGIAWKTGTSFGFRDAWAVGVNSRFVVGVWAGNADGEGRPGLVGVRAAAPILFDIFQLLPTAEAFQPPYDEMVELAVCKNSGLRPSELCPTDTIWATTSAQKVELCTYHQRVHLDSTGRFQVHADCESPSKMQHRGWFVLPPVEAHYYQAKNPTYAPLPPYRTDCETVSTNANQSMQLIYPKYTAQIYVPVDLDGQRSRTVFKVAHRQNAATIFWHLDDEYLGETQYFHEMELQPATGKHRLTLVDEKGNRIEQEFTIVN
ncbi:MAG: penicillin-binding protein 1C [Saprospiraceae bacterium]